MGGEHLPFIHLDSVTPLPDKSSGGCPARQNCKVVPLAVSKLTAPKERPRPKPKPTSAMEGISPKQARSTETSVVTLPCGDYWIYVLTSVAQI